MKIETYIYIYERPQLYTVMWNNLKSKPISVLLLSHFVTIYYR